VSGRTRGLLSLATDFTDLHGLGDGESVGRRWNGWLVRVGRKCGCAVKVGEEPSCVRQPLAPQEGLRHDSDPTGAGMEEKRAEGARGGTKIYVAVSGLSPLDGRRGLRILA